MNLAIWQMIFYTSAILLLPVAPFLFWLGGKTRRKIGLLPNAAGSKRGKVGDFPETVKLLVIGESIVAGLGARTHETALAGQFAKFLSEKIGRSVEYYVIGRNGVTARRTIDELVPLIPENEIYDYVMLGVGGNDVLKLSSPRKWRRTALELLGIMREKYPNATIFMTNAPAVHLSPVLPQPIKFLLGRLSKLHDQNTKEFTANLKKVFYFHRPDEITEGFFADGIHPSERGYTDWSKRMIDFFTEKYDW